MDLRNEYNILRNFKCSMLLNESALGDKSSIYVVVKDFFGNGLMSSEEEVWKVHRKLLNPAFYVGVLKGKMPIFNENAVSLVEKLRSVEGKPTEELIDILKYCAFNIMSESILGLKMTDEKFGSKIVKYMENIETLAELSIYRVVHPWLCLKFLLPFFHSGRKYLEIVEEIHRFANELIEDLKKSVIISEEKDQHLNSEVEVRKSFTHILIEQHFKDSTFTSDDVRDHINTLMATETLRLYPTVPVFARKAKREFQCGQYKIPEGTDIVFCPFMLHRNPDIYPEPGKFDPERFSENFEIRLWMHIPFAEGYRNCIGKKFAMMEMKVQIMHVLRHFKITPKNKIEDSDLDWNIVLKPTKPIQVSFTDRHSQS